MKSFVSPEMQVVEGLNMEPVYAGSGTFPSVTPNNNVRAEWRNHNSGSHSEVAFVAKDLGVAGESITANFVVEGFKLTAIKDTGGFLFTNVTENGFTVTRNNHFNATDSIEFNFQITGTSKTLEDAGKYGAVGTTGQECPYSIKCVSYILN